MTQVKVQCFAVSLDGFSAGTDQSLENPLGVRGPELMQWFFPTETFQSIHGQGEGKGEKGVDNDMAKASFVDIGAWIMGRNMFGPVRGPWPDDEWKGWWGEEPPYHVPTFVLTHHPRESIVMKGGTVFHFVTGGIHEALGRAREAAGGKDVRIGGGTSTVRQYMQAGLIDELHLAVSPVLLGAGENLWQGQNASALGYECYKTVAGERATHMFLRRKQ